jgi:hypothetical protein
MNTISFCQCNQQSNELYCPQCNLLSVQRALEVNSQLIIDRRMQQPQYSYVQHTNVYDNEDEYRCNESQMEWGGSSGSSNTISVQGHKVDELIQAYMTFALTKDETKLNYVSNQALCFQELPNYAQININKERRPLPTCIATQLRNRIEEELLLRICYQSILSVPLIFNYLHDWMEETDLNKNYHVLSCINRLLCKFTDFNELCIDLTYSCNSLKNPDLPDRKSVLHYSYNKPSDYKLLDEKYTHGTLGCAFEWNYYGMLPNGPLPYHVHNVRHNLVQFRLCLINCNSSMISPYAIAMLQAEEETKLTHSAAVESAFQALIEEECSYTYVNEVKSSHNHRMLERVKRSNGRVYKGESSNKAKVQAGNLQFRFFDSSNKVLTPEDLDNYANPAPLIDYIEVEEVQTQRRNGFPETIRVKKRKAIQYLYIDRQSEVYLVSKQNVLDCTRVSKPENGGYRRRERIIEELLKQRLPILEQLSLTYGFISLDLVHPIIKPDGKQTDYKYNSNF